MFKPCCLFLLGIFIPLAGAATPSDKPDEAAAPKLARTVVLEGVMGTRPTAGVPGRFDHFAYDPATHRLFVAALENGSLEVIDLDKWERVKSITGLAAPEGIAVVPTVGCAVVACSGGNVHVYDTRTLEEKKVIDLGKGADNVRYDAKADTVYVAYGAVEGGALAVFNPHTWEKVREIKFKHRPESFQLESVGERMFANLPAGIRANNDGIVAVFDRNSGEIEKEIQLKDRARNFPMAFDAANNRLFIACRKPAKLIEIDTKNNVMVTEADCGEDSDDLFYDAKTGHVMVICGGFRPDMQDPKPDPASPPRDETGTIDVFSVGEKGELKQIASTRTAPHARTGYFVPDYRAVYVAVPMRDGRPPEIREYKIGD